jgi:hypothetical protein
MVKIALAVLVLGGLLALGMVLTYYDLALPE